MCAHTLLYDIPEVCVSVKKDLFIRKTDLLKIGYLSACLARASRTSSFFSRYETMSDREREDEPSKRCSPPLSRSHT